MKTAEFNANGGPLRVAVRCEPNRPGSYHLMLWEADTNDVVMQRRGNFINCDDDEYLLDPQPAMHDGRLVEVIVVVSVPAGVGPSTVSLNVSQGELELACDSSDVAPGSAAQMVDLFIQLKRA